MDINGPHYERDAVKRTKKPSVRRACHGKGVYATKEAALNGMYQMAKKVGANLRAMHAYCCRVDWTDGTNRPAWHYGHRPGRGGGIVRGRIL